MKSAPLILLFVSVFFISSCNKSDDSPTLAESHGFNHALLDNAIEAGRADGGMKCLIINKDGVDIVEEYFNDHPDSTYHVRSVTKSFMSAIFGIAVDQGYISLDETIEDYLDQDYVLREEVKGITIEDLLTMTAGFEWDEFTNFTDYWNPWATSDDLIQHSLDLNFINIPGQVFTYNTAVSHILSAIFTKATGQDLVEFGNTYLFGPMDMSDNIEWWADDDGFVYGGVMLHVTPGDMLKLGLLYLHNGMYNGTRIVSEEWVEASHFPHIVTGHNLGSHYGYQWWMDTFRGQHYYFANGYRGQFIFVFPDYDLVVVTRSDNTLVPGRSSNQQWSNTSSIIVNQVFGALN